jgi:hypothetical protein
MVAYPEEQEELVARGYKAALRDFGVARMKGRWPVTPGSIRQGMQEHGLTRCSTPPRIT